MRRALSQASPRTTELFEKFGDHLWIGDFAEMIDRVSGARDSGWFERGELAHHIANVFVAGEADEEMERTPHPSPLPRGEGGVELLLQKIYCFHSCPYFVRVMCAVENNEWFL